MKSHEQLTANGSCSSHKTSKSISCKGFKPRRENADRLNFLKREYLSTEPLHVAPVSNAKSDISSAVHVYWVKLIQEVIPLQG